ncbi:MAG: capsular biosynthesis protein [Gammaproteobacteria bacterium]
MTVRTGTAVQINVYPMDLRHVKHLLPHQIRVWGDMVDRIVVTVDVHQSRSGRYRGKNFAESLAQLHALLAEHQKRFSKLEVVEVDYRPETLSKVAQYFFGTSSMPVKAWDGGPFYAYFYGLYATPARYIVHFDGDLLFGGGSRTWLSEAIALLESREDVLLVSPFPGPPREDGRLFGHQQDQGFSFAREPMESLAYRFSHASTRIFAIDMVRFEQTLGAFPLIPPHAIQRLKAKLLGNPPIAREAEVILSIALERSKLLRIDFLGTAPGLWGLHPPYRSEEFYTRLPEIIERVEQNRVPEAQRGDYELNDSIIDWTEARAATRWHRRYFRLLRDRLSRPSFG